jgi:hypothetical protein
MPGERFPLVDLIGEGDMAANVYKAWQSNLRRYRIKRLQ